ncbi:transcriptional regulator [Rathayibacter tanaceti]|uniref:transcriptional regulator n=1 Tax=Rathayibacter tanaceti TaxID=1671680 RepID=UPI001F1F4068|nr:transcriptional regulator [Rathayibacter tanaceti]
MRRSGVRDHRPGDRHSALRPLEGRDPPRRGRYARIRKGHIGRRSRTWLSLTPAGRSAFARHLEALDDLTNRARTTASSEADPAD